MGVIPVVLLAWFLWRVHKRRANRRDSADALTAALGEVKPYKGRAWRVGERWL